ncbi:MAG TPA: GNAT family N-acetyltransferase [Burkholderiales bacterium]
MVHDAAALQRVLPAWEELVQQAIEPNPLYEPWMLLPALRARPSADFRCALAWTAPGKPGGPSALGGLFPFERVSRFKGLPVRAVRSWRHRSWMLGTPLLRGESARECLRALFDWVGATGRASLIEFEYTPADGPFHGVLADVSRERDAIAVTTSGFTRALLRKGTGEASGTEAALAGELRKSLRRKERRLGEQGALSRVALRAGDDVHRWIDEFLRLEASGWKGRRRSALACSEQDRRFATEMLAGAFARGRLQMLGLDFDGRPIARCCNLIAGDASYAYRCAYDEDFARFSPGVMAEVDTMRHFQTLPGVRWMDSLTDPDNMTLNRLWNDRRTIQTVLVGIGPWGGLWASLLPLLRWAKRCGGLALRMARWSARKAAAPGGSAKA